MLYPLRVLCIRIYDSVFQLLKCRRLLHAYMKFLFSTRSIDTPLSILLVEVWTSSYKVKALVLGYIDAGQSILGDY